MKSLKILISGGGTGGHIFPAIAIANALKVVDPNIDILFVGAKGKMEMEKVPAAGYKIIGLNIMGLQRRLTWKNLLFPFKLIGSLLKAKQIIKNFKPDVVVGVGGYASGPILRIATQKNIPTLIQEQNSYPGITNKILAQKVTKICVAYDGMDKYFPKEKLVLTGNPVRQDIIAYSEAKADAIKFFGIDTTKPVLLVVGGSLGARTINESIFENLKTFEVNGIQLIWQTGKNFYEQMNLAQHQNEHTKIYPFITKMNLAYAVADVVVSRAGAIAISELCLVQKPCILVPSPNVAEDHQTKNAMALVNHQAAILVKDSEAKENLVKKAIELIKDKEQQQKLQHNIAGMAFYNAAETIANEVIKLGKR